MRKFSCRDDILYDSLATLAITVVVLVSPLKHVRRAELALVRIIFIARWTLPRGVLGKYLLRSSSEKCLSRAPSCVQFKPERKS